MAGVRANWLGREKAYLSSILGGEMPRPGPPAGMDWAAFETAVDHHRLALAVGRILPELDGMPEPIRANLSAKSRAATMRTLGRNAEIVRVVSALDQAGVQVLVLKGAATSAQFHGHPVARVSSDIDLLVRRLDGARATEILFGLGYRAPGNWRERRGPFTEATLVNPDRHQVIDLHTRLAPDDRQFPAALIRPFETAAEVDLGPYRIQTLPAEAALVHAAMHGCKHLWRRLGWLHDIAEAMRRDRVPWRGALDLAIRLGVERQLALACLLAEAVFAAPLPEPLIDHAALPVAHKAMDALKPILAGSDHGEDIEAVRAMGRLRYLAWENQLHRGWRRRLHALMVHARPSPTDLDMVRLPEAFGFLYVPIRAVRVLWKSLTS